MFKSICLIVLIIGFQTIKAFNFKRVCYIRPEPQIPLNHIIEANLCSHLIIGFVSVGNNSILIDGINENFYKRCKSAINALNSETVLMFSIGGGNNENGFHSAALTQTNRKMFANSALEVIVKYGFDGIDLDWEFPAWANTYSEDKENFILLIKQIRETFSDYTSNNRKIPLLLSAAVAAQYLIVRKAYDVPQLIKHVDFVNLMTYDFYLYHWYWPFVGHNSPLFARSLDWGLFSTLNTEWSANYWHIFGFNKTKIIVGIPTYGRSFHLAFPQWFTSPGALVMDTSEDTSYSENCKFLRTNGTQIVFDSESRTHYAFRDNVWLTYESEESAAHKAKWIRNNGFGGVMTFSLNADDFKHECSDKVLFPIQSVIRRAVIN